MHLPASQQQRAIGARTGEDRANGDGVAAAPQDRRSPASSCAPDETRQQHKLHVASHLLAASHIGVALLATPAPASAAAALPAPAPGHGDDHHETQPLQHRHRAIAALRDASHEDPSLPACHLCPAPEADARQAVPSSSVRAEDHPRRILDTTMVTTMATISDYRYWKRLGLPKLPGSNDSREG